MWLISKIIQFRVKEVEVQQSPRLESVSVICEFGVANALTNS